MVIRLGRNGRFLACSLFPEHKESRPLPGDEPPPQAGEGEVCPQCGEGTLVGKTRPVRAVRRLLALPGLHYIKKEGPPPPDPLPFEVDLPEEQRRPSRRRGARAGPATSSGAARTTRSATSRRTSSRSARSTTPTTGPVAKHGETGICLTLRRGRCRCPRASSSSARGWRAGRRTRRRSRKPARGGGAPRRAGAVARRRGPRPAARTRAPERAGAAAGGTRGAADAGDRERARRVSGGAGGRPRARAVPPRSLAARDASRAHPALVRDDRRRLPRLARLRAASTGGRRPGPTSAPTSPHLGAAGRAQLRRPAAGRDPLVPSLRRPRGPRGRRPVGRDRDAAPAAPPAARPRGRPGRAAARGGRRRAGRRRRGDVAEPSDLRRARAPRPGARRDGLRGGPPDQRAGGGRSRRRSSCGAARSGSSARAARSGSGCSAGRPAAALAAYLEDGRPMLLVARRAARRGGRRARRRSS